MLPEHSDDCGDRLVQAASAVTAIEALRVTNWDLREAEDVLMTHLMQSTDNLSDYEMLSEALICIRQYMAFDEEVSLEGLA